MRMYQADQARAQVDLADDARTRVQARGPSNDRMIVNSVEGQEQAHYSLRTASWESAHALTVADASVQGPGDRYVDPAAAAPLSHPGRKHIRDGGYMRPF